MNKAEEFVNALNKACSIPKLKDFERELNAVFCKFKVSCKNIDISTVFVETYVIDGYNITYDFSKFEYVKNKKEG